MESWIYSILFLYKRYDTDLELWENLGESEVPHAKRQIAKRQLPRIPPFDDIFDNVCLLDFKSQPDYDDYKSKIVEKITDVGYKLEQVQDFRSF